MSVSPNKGRKTVTRPPIQSQLRSRKRTARSSTVIFSDRSSSPDSDTIAPKKSSSVSNSSKKRTSAVRNSDDDDESSVDKPTTSKNKSSNTQRLAEVPENDLVNKCVYYLLIADQKKFAIKRADIVKHVFQGQSSKSYSTVLVKANSILKKTFGLELLEIKNRKSEYMLINFLHPNSEKGLMGLAEFSRPQLQHKGLVLTILTIIFMKGNTIAEEDLWKALEPLGIDVNSRAVHPVFGDVKKYITVELTKQMYLEQRVVNREANQVEFLWGERANQEVAKADLLKFACMVMGDADPEDWIMQFKDAQKENESA